MRQPPAAPPRVQIRTGPRYTLSASGNSSSSPETFVAEEPSPIPSPDALTRFEKCGLAQALRKIQEPRVARMFPHNPLRTRARTGRGGRSFLFCKEAARWVHTK